MQKIYIKIIMIILSINANEVLASTLRIYSRRNSGGNPDVPQPIHVFIFILAFACILLAIEKYNKYKKNNKIIDESNNWKSTIKWALFYILLGIYFTNRYYDKLLACINC